MTDDEVLTFWEAHYGRSGHIWSGRPNEALVAEVEGLQPGDALDLGCGEGADAVWLAARGWRVLAVDVSTTALRRAAAAAEQADVADRIEWLAVDLAGWRPDRSFDLVSAQFLHSPVELPREAVLRTAASAVAPGGRLLVVGHADVPPWAPPHHDHIDLPGPDEVHASLGLPEAAWTVETTELSLRAVTGPDGEQAHLRDAVLHLRRR